MFKKVFVIFWFSFCLVLIMVLVVSGGVGVVEVAEARQGCCSAHAGVCGCSCCDGTPLSDVCAPYYSECEVDSFGNDRAEMKPLEKNSSFPDGWEFVVVYAVGVGLILFFAKKSS